jgi:hypothetical protein
MRAAPFPSEPRSTTGRVIRPAVRTSPGGVMPPVHNQAVSRYGTGRSGMVRENGPRTTLPYLLRGLTPPSLPCLGDRVIRSFTKTIVDLQRVMLDHRAGRLHGGEQVGQRFPQPNAAMPDPLGLPHRDVTLCDSGRAPTARGDTLHGLTAIRDHGSKDSVPNYRVPYTAVLETKRGRHSTCGVSTSRLSNQIKIIRLQTHLDGRYVV